MKSRIGCPSLLFLILFHGLGHVGRLLPREARLGSAWSFGQGTGNKLTHDSRLRSPLRIPGCETMGRQHDACCPVSGFLLDFTSTQFPAALFWIDMASHGTGCGQGRIDDQEVLLGLRRVRVVLGCFHV